MPKFLSQARPIPLLSLDATPSVGKDGDSLDLLDIIPDQDEQNPVDSLLQEERKEVLKKAITKLPKNEQFVLSLYYNEDANLREIAVIMGLTEARVSQIRTKAIAILRSYLSEYLDL